MNSSNRHFFSLLALAERRFAKSFKVRQSAGLCSLLDFLVSIGLICRYRVISGYIVVFPRYPYSGGVLCRVQVLKRHLRVAVLRGRLGGYEVGYDYIVLYSRGYGLLSEVPYGSICILLARLIVCMLRNSVDFELVFKNIFCDWFTCVHHLVLPFNFWAVFYWSNI